MKVRDLHSKLGLLGMLQFNRSQSVGAISDRLTLKRPVYIESLLKHIYLPKHFGHSFDEIMHPSYCLADVKATNRFTEYSRANPEADLLSTRANIQSSAIISLINEAEEWIETNDISYKHQGNLQSICNSIKEYFEKGGEYEYSWDRLKSAFQALAEEELLPCYQKFTQFQRRYNRISALIAGESLLENKDMQKETLKEMDDLQWYFDTWCVGATEIDDLPEEGVLLAPVEEEHVVKKNEQVEPSSADVPSTICNVTVWKFSGLVECNNHSKNYVQTTQAWSIINRCACGDPSGSTSIDFLVQQGKDKIAIDGALKDINDEWKIHAQCRILRREGDRIHLGKISVKSQKHPSRNTEEHIVGTV